MNIYFMSQSFEKECELEEKWYKTKYKVEEISDQLKEIMKNPKCDQSEKKLNFPPHNTLIPTEFDLKERVAENCKEPKLLKSADGTEVWHQQDNKFDKPKEIVTLYLYSNDCHESKSPKGDVFISLWNKVMENYQREFQYTSNMASLGFSFSNYMDQFVFTWYGYS